MPLDLTPALPSRGGGKEGRMKVETISIEVKGSKKFIKEVIKQVHDLLTSEEFCEGVAKPGCGVRLTSSIDFDPEEDDLI